MKPTWHWRAGCSSPCHRSPPSRCPSGRRYVTDRPMQQLRHNADGFVRGEGCWRGGAQAVGRRGLTRTGCLRWSAVRRRSRWSVNGMTAPNALAQRDVITSALKLAGCTPDSVNYVGNTAGTVLGTISSSRWRPYGLGKGQGEPVRIIGQDQHRPPGGGHRCGWIHQGGAGGATWAHSHNTSPGGTTIDASATRLFIDRKRPWPGGCRSTQGCTIIVRSSSGITRTWWSSRHRLTAVAAAGGMPYVSALNVSGKTAARVASAAAGAGRLDVRAGRGGTAQPT